MLFVIYSLEQWQESWLFVNEATGLISSV